MENTLKVFGITEKKEATSYPYGRLRTSAFFSIEFAVKKGFRSVFQTINPKSGVLNKEKKSTYYDFLFLIEDENEHFKTVGTSIHGLKDCQRVIEWLNQYSDKLQLSADMITYLKGRMLTTFAISSAYVKQDSPDYEEIKKLYKESPKALQLTNADFSEIEPIIKRLVILKEL